MDILPPDPPRGPSDGNLLPMINVVFLLLIFFLISAELAPPEPFPVTPPEARPQDARQGDFALYLGADGALGFEGATSPGADGDPTVLAALKAAHDTFCDAHDCAAAPPQLFLRADAGAPVDRLAALLPELGGAGFPQADLVIRSTGDDADGAPAGTATP
ncbi:ExbD/TolR family protein [Acidimangrovimonas sediminis]|uniref:ExbD/TolR family protein n=1 Tax=Acidimangrovimonas sediminis TaxID=2056283 RepID=UPI000C8011F8|nr:biopolymer transporter ExbD [Acidimangrovimonas sediminis]